MYAACLRLVGKNKIERKSLSYTPLLLLLLRQGSPSIYGLTKTSTLAWKWNGRTGIFFLLVLHLLLFKEKAAFVCD